MYLCVFDSLTKGFPQQANMLRKIALLDEFFRPNLFHEDVLLNKMASTQYEREKGVKAFGGRGTTRPSRSSTRSLASKQKGPNW